MKRAILTIMVLAFVAVPALAAQNPDVQIYLYTTSTGIGGTNHKASPAPGANTSVYVCFDHFGPGGGLWGSAWKFIDVPGPSFLSTTNQFVGVGGLTIGDPASALGCAMTVGPVPVYPDANGIIVVARIRYETPEEMRRGGSITVIPHSTDENIIQDANNETDRWCVRSVAQSGLSGNFGWDDSAIPDGNCPLTPVEARSWGSIKALYR